VPVRPGDRVPIGVALARTAKAASAAFDAAMSEAGGSLSIWLVLLSLKTSRGASQRAMAESMGIQGATLTHHLNGMEGSGLVTRRRDPENRRVHIVELTASGEELFEKLRSVALAFDDQLRGDLDSAELDRFRQVLDRLGQNISAGSTASAEWAPSAPLRDGSSA
jgi:MarR family transcriptional regulator, transcriptional regulator for hemolysin